MSYSRRAFKYLRPYWHLALCSVALIVLAAGVGLLAPWPLQVLVDHVLQDAPLPAWLPAWIGNRETLLAVAVTSGLLITLLQNLVTVIDHYVNARLEQSMVLDFRSDLFQHAQRLSMSFHDRKRSGMVIYAINSQGDGVARLIMVIPPLAQSLLTLIGMFWITYQLDPQLALVSLVVVPVLFYSVRHYMTRIQPFLQQVRDMEGESLSIVHEAMSMLKVIVAFGREQHEFTRFRRQGERAVNARVKVTVRQTLFNLVVNTTTAAGTALVLGIGAHHVLTGQLSVGQLLVVMSYIAAVYQPLEAISTTVGSLQEVFVALQMGFDLLDTPTDVADRPGAVDIGRTSGAIRYDSVQFEYVGRKETLRDVAFEVAPGELVAVVGPTGAGKTTLVSLLPRFYDVKEGRILLDGRDIRELTLRSLRQQISIVMQEPLLFSASIADNIRYGRFDATEEEVIEAARNANAHDFIMRLPKQYQTELGERGAQLSGGERQRISVARAFLKDAPILILDEPTSSIDSKTEVVILDALDRLMVGRTTFMIAHRLSTVRHSDKILVVDHGRIVEQGTHEQLLERNGLYKNLHDLQRGRVAQGPLSATLLEASGDPTWGPR